MRLLFQQRVQFLHVRVGADGCFESRPLLPVFWGSGSRTAPSIPWHPVPPPPVGGRTVRAAIRLGSHADRHGRRTGAVEPHRSGHSAHRLVRQHRHRHRLLTLRRYRDAGHGRCAPHAQRWDFVQAWQRELQRSVAGHQGADVRYGRQGDASLRQEYRRHAGDRLRQGRRSVGRGAAALRQLRPRPAGGGDQLHRLGQPARPAEPHLRRDGHRRLSVSGRRLRQSDDQRRGVRQREHRSGATATVPDQEDVDGARGRDGDRPELQPQLHRQHRRRTGADGD